MRETPLGEKKKKNTMCEGRVQSFFLLKATFYSDE